VLSPLALSIITTVAALAQAPVVVTGTYTTGRGPCQQLPDGSRRWPLLRGFRIHTVYRGTVRAGYVGLEAPAGLTEGTAYLVLLRPAPPALERLADPDAGPSLRDALGPDEVVAILKP
jgi:hypothetical protein